MICAFEIPADPEQIAPWLESHLLGLDLAALVAELAAVHGDKPARQPQLEEVLGEDLPRVLTAGLTVLRPQQLQRLLQNPRLLLQLQSRIFVEGDTFWEQDKQLSDELGELVDRGWNRVRGFLNEQQRKSHSEVATHTAESSRPAAPASSAPGSRATASGSAQSARRSWFNNPLLVSVCTAAAVVATIFLIDPSALRSPDQVAQGWGWQKPGAIDDTATPSEYLDGLATAAQDWFNKRPETPQELAQRILTFRQGCSQLILSDHRPLAAEDREWLVERCQVWAGKLDEHVAALESGVDVATVRGAADETINKLVTALRKRAEAVS